MMKETDIYTLVSSLIEAELAKQEINTIVKYNVQPDVADTDPTIYLSTSSIKYKGFLKRNDQIKAAEIEHSEGQLYESIIKITGQVIRDTSIAINSLPITSLDLTKKVATLLQSDVVRLALKKQGIGMIKIDEITQTFYSNNEANNNQTFASFNFTICFEEVSKTTSPITRSFEFKQYRV